MANRTTNSSSRFSISNIIDRCVSAVVPPEDVDEDDSASDRPPVTIVNKAAKTSGYSGNLYDIASATKEGVIYPAADPSIFELKFPSIDIEGRVVGDSAGGGN